MNDDNNINDYYVKISSLENSNDALLKQHNLDFEKIQNQNMEIIKLQESLMKNKQEINKYLTEKNSFIQRIAEFEKEINEKNKLISKLKQNDEVFKNKVNMISKKYDEAFTELNNLKQQRSDDDDLKNDEIFNLKCEIQQYKDNEKTLLNHNEELKQIVEKIKEQLLDETNANDRLNQHINQLNNDLIQLKGEYNKIKSQLRNTELELNDKKEENEFLVEEKKKANTLKNENVRINQENSDLLRKS